MNCSRTKKYFKIFFDPFRAYYKQTGMKRNENKVEY